MTYQVQFRNNGKWRRALNDAWHSKLDKAIERVTKCDPDGLFDPNARIIADGFMYTYQDWTNARNK